MKSPADWVVGVQTFAFVAPFLAAVTLKMAFSRREYLSLVVVASNDSFVNQTLL